MTEKQQVPTESTRQFDLVPLPSRGKLYPKNHPLYGIEAVECYYLTAREEDILTSPNLIRSGNMLNAVLKSVLVDRTIDASKMLLADRNAIMIWLRSTGYGPEYDVILTCNSCDESFHGTFDLSALDEYISEELPNDDGEFTFTLPVSKKTITFKLMTGEDENDVHKLSVARKEKLNVQVDNSITARFLKMITSVEGNTDLNVIRDFIDIMPIKDSREFKKYREKVESQLIMKQDITCTRCGALNAEVSIPITGAFFWPDIDA